MKNIKKRSDKIRRRAKKSTEKFKLEIKKSITTAIVAAFGFLIALTWRDVITEWTNRISALSPLQGKLMTAIIITIISIIGILIVTKFLSVKK